MVWILDVSPGTFLQVLICFNRAGTSMFALTVCQLDTASQERTELFC